jgi:two-component system cell cycle response regulator
MDIDYFKSVNDTHGHDIGDEILREFATRIGANVRGIDLACRYGGEEFVVVMPDTDVSFAYAVAERLRRSVETTPFEISRMPGSLKVTISIGIAGSEGVADTAEALLHRADQALYRAKRDGRNRVVADAA